MTLVTTDGDRIRGTWQDSSGEDRALHWHAEQFAEPFEFPIENVSAVYQRTGQQPELAATSWICETANGDMFFGSPESLDDEGLVFAVSTGAEQPHSIRIPMAFVRQLRSVKQASESLLTLPGDGAKLLEKARGGWTMTGDGAFHGSGDDLTATTEIPELPRQCSIDLEFSWEQASDFEIEIGKLRSTESTFKKPQDNRARMRLAVPVANGTKTATTPVGIFIQTWHDQLVVLVRDTEQADVLLVSRDSGKLRSGGVALKLLLDADSGLLDVYDENQRLGELKLPSQITKQLDSLLNSIRFTLHSGDLKVQHIQLSSWNGRAPEIGNATLQQIRLADGQVLGGKITGYDKQSREFTAIVDDEEVNVASDEIEVLVFRGGEKLPNDSAEVRVSRLDGTRLAGQYRGVENGFLQIQAEYLQQPVSFPIEGLSAIGFSVDKGAREESLARVGTLRLAHSTIAGQLQDGIRNEQTSCLFWKPNSARAARPLLPTASGVIHYRDPLPTSYHAPTPDTESEPKKAAGAGILGGVLNWVNDANRELKDRFGSTSSSNTKSKTNKPRKQIESLMELRSGDAIPVVIQHIDAKGVTFSSRQSDVTFVEHEYVKAVSLQSKILPAELTSIKRERLLTVPRKLSKYPPTHLLLSVNKDLLRGRLVSIDDETVAVEVRLTTRKIPRERVAAIVWLDKPKEPDQNGEQPPAEAVNLAVPEGPLRVLATKRGGNRITILPERCQENTLFGQNPVLQQCSLDLDDVDQLVFGESIQSTVNDLATSKLTMKIATMPRYLTEEGESTGRESGQESQLVGNKAPEIDLKDLNGKPFKLAAYRNKVLVLDFWATWCGPCIQWMPKLDKIVEEFEGKDVELVTINLGEDAKRITPVLQRMELSPPVVLDLDGVVAEAYQANAIPQTVIIDQQGNVDRVFVGGGSQNEEPVRQAIEALLKP